MASESSRKKRKMASTEPSPAGPAPVIASSELPTPHNTSAAMTDKAANAPCHHEQALKALNTDLDAMRSLITCKICDRFLYEPYALSCGHTYCYSCLSQWLGSNAKMTCPDCRTVIRQQPTPSYLIRELVLVFVSRNELLPDGETAEEHNKAVKEEAEIVVKDRENADRRTGGLFKGRFNKPRLDVLYDPGDGVRRCPGCHWELEEGHCIQCGYENDDLDNDFSLDESESSIGYASDEDIDHELGAMNDDRDVFVGADGADNWGHVFAQTPDPPGRQVNFHTIPRRWPQYGRPANAAGPIPIDLDEESSEGESEEDEYDHDDTFIDDEAIEAAEEGSDAESDVTAGRPPTQPARRRNGRPGPVVISDDEDEGDEDEGDEVVTIRRNPAPSTGPRWRGGRAAPIAISEDGREGEETAPSVSRASEDSESDSEDEGPVVRGSQRYKRPNVAVRPRRAVTVSSDGDHDSESGTDDRIQGTAQGGFSPIDNGFGDGASEQTDYDTDFYGNEEAEDEDDEAGGFAGAAPEYFNPYEEDAGPGGYDEQSDGWGSLDPIIELPDMKLTGVTGTTARTGSGGPRFGRQPRLPSGPSTRLGTLQQRRPRHASPQHRPRSTLSPTTALRPTQSIPQLDGYYDRTALAYTRTSPTLQAHLNGQARAQELRSRLRENRLNSHPFQLDNVLSSINYNNNNNSNNNIGRTYNQRNQQARTYSYSRNPTSGTTSNDTNRGGFAMQAGSSTSRRHAVGSRNDGRRKRELSVSSDDSQDFYV